jgi:NADH dehydrogenase
MAGAIAELAGDEKRHGFGGDPNMRVRVVLIEAGTALLPHFPPDLSNRALTDLSDMGVEVHVGTSVTDISAGAVHLGDAEIAAETIIWTAGVEASPVASWLGVAPAHGGRVKVRPDLTLPGHPEVFVIGDAAEALDRFGKPLPGLAPVAKQQGDYVARVIIGRLDGRSADIPFVYQDFGTLATIGRNRAVAWFGRVHVTGFAAWVTWAVAHIFFLMGFRNRVLVGTKWMMSYVSHQRGSRVIT